MLTNDLFAHFSSKCIVCKCFDIFEQTVREREVIKYLTEDHSDKMYYLPARVMFAHHFPANFDNI